MLYDLLLYLVRTAVYELPIYGGRARGQTRPRAPSLSERPDGKPRRFSLAGGPATATATDLHQTHQTHDGSGIREREKLKGSAIVDMEDSTFD